MDNILGYYVFDQSKGGWLQDGEKTWAQDFYGAYSFPTAKLANSVGEAACPEGRFYVLACLGSM